MTWNRILPDLRVPDLEDGQSAGLWVRMNGEPIFEIIFTNNGPTTKCEVNPMHLDGSQEGKVETTTRW
jgi:hypothetical protein